MTASDGRLRRDAERVLRACRRRPPSSTGRSSRAGGRAGRRGAGRGERGRGEAAAQEVPPVQGRERWVMRCPLDWCVGWRCCWVVLVVLVRGSPACPVAHVPQPDASGVALLEGDVVLVAAGDVGGEVEGRPARPSATNRSATPRVSIWAMYAAVIEETAPTGTSAADRDRRVAVRGEVVDRPRRRRPSAAARSGAWAAPAWCGRATSPRSPGSRAPSPRARGRRSSR